MSEIEKPLSDKPGGNYITQAWLVIVLALLYGGALAGVQLGLGPIIIENQLAETQDQIPALVQGAVKGEPISVVIDEATDKRVQVYRAVDAGGNVKGWVLPANGQGFADQIKVLIGLDAELTAITGLFVLEQKETPGLGDYITGEDFRNRFVGQSTGSPLEVVTSDPGDQEIQALTGATISSQSVADIVNQAVETLREPIRQQMATRGKGEPGVTGDQ
jgi:electron transport complex protein RnfG